MDFIIVSNREKDRGLECGHGLAARLKALTGAEPPVLDYQRSFVHGSGEPLNGCSSDDIVIALGGDGTILHVAKDAALKGAAVLGVNIGRLGFIAGMEYSELADIGRLLDGRYRTEERMMLEVTADGKVWHALNDAVVSKGALSRMIDLSVECDGRFISNYRADGLVFSTPTGSTAYALSAGGPVVDPQLDSIGVTPMCPHSLVSRAILFSPGATLSVRVRATEGVEAFLAVDGQDIVRLTGGEPVKIRRSPVRARLVLLKDVSFYEALADKLAGK